MSTRVHEYPLLIIERHLDTFGHVNNATYLQILEEARWEWLTGAGFGMERMIELGQGPTILECTLRFRRELRNRSQVKIVSEVVSYVGKIGRVRQEIRLPSGEVACEAEFVIALFDTERRKLIDPSPLWLEGLGLSAEDWKPRSEPA
jgi:thioesterase III